MTEHKKTSQPKPEPQKIVLNADRLQEISDQYTEAMEELQKRVEAADPSDLTSDEDFGKEFYDQQVELARQVISEVRKTDPQKAGEMELKLKQMLEQKK